MKTENMLVTSVKAEPLNYVVSNSQTYAENLYPSATKKQRLASDEWMNHNQSNNNMNHDSTMNMSGFSSPDINFEAYSPNSRMNIDDHNGVNNLMGDGIDGKKTKKGPVPRQQEELCLVCGDRASGYHYNALTCEGCKGFFRRSVTKNAVYCCKFGHSCEMDMYMRRKCQECRLKKCLAVGMRPECVVPENQCAIKRKEKKAQKEKDKATTSGPINSSTSPVSVQTNRTNSSEFFKSDFMQNLMKCDPPLHQMTHLISENVLSENKNKNIPHLTTNQMSIIYKLIWYQDGYEQPSEEDLKRIEEDTADEGDSEEAQFRYITELTILTVQLIVEFAKGLPAFNKLPQEDQITLLKACSSEVMMLRVARRYDDGTGTILFANNQSYSSERYNHMGIGYLAEDLIHFCKQLFNLDVDNVEYSLITAIVIFSDRPGLEKTELVDLIQSYYIETLRVYIINRYGGSSICTIHFAKLLSILTELRTLGNKNSEMCFSLKLRNKRLPKFLEEVWDVPELGSENNTATTNTETIVRDKLNRETTSRSEY